MTARWRPVLMPSGMVMFIPPPECTVTYGTYPGSTQVIPFTRKQPAVRPQGLAPYVTEGWRRLLTELVFD